MKYKFVLFLFFFCFALPFKINSAPFDSDTITFFQPDNTSFLGRIWGDEFIYWSETSDGYSFVQAQDGWYYYAQLNESGEYTSSEFLVGIDSPPPESYKLERSEARMEEIHERIQAFNNGLLEAEEWYSAKQEEANLQGHPNVDISIGIILIEFKDVSHFTSENRPNGYTYSDFEDMMFSENVWQGVNKHPEGDTVFGSFKNYWDQISLGKLDISGRVVNPDLDNNGVPDWLVSDYERVFYTLETTPYEALAEEAINKAIVAGLIDTLSGPNHFDKLVIIFAQRVVDTRLFAYADFHQKYIQVPEQSSKELWQGGNYTFTHIGIYAHEFGHNLGFNEEYCFGESDELEPTSPEDGFTNTYNFDLMGLGIYNGPLRKGECPATLSPYYRIKKNWVIPTVLDGHNNLVVHYNYASPEFYKIVPYNGATDEHYIIESKGRTGFDLYVPTPPIDTLYQSGRLVIWQHNTSTSSPELYNDRIRIKTADNIRDKLTQLDDFFPCLSFNNIQSLNDTTIPMGTVRDYDPRVTVPLIPGHLLLNGIQNIGNNNTLIRKVRKYYPLPEYTNFSSQATFSGDWQMVSVPLVVPNYSDSVLFPTNIIMYSYNNGYQLAQTLANGPGYFCLFPSSPQTVSMTGEVIDVDTVPLVSGWQITGSISKPIARSNVYTLPADSILIIYNYGSGGYTLADTIKPGYGYWTYSSSNVNMILENYDYFQKLPVIDFATMDKFRITDAEGYCQNLYVTNTDIDSLMRGINLELPPMFSELPFDSRFQFNEYVKRVNSDSGVVSLDILVHTLTYPITLTWEINPTNGINYSFIGNGGLGKNHNVLNSMGKIALDNLTEGRIKLLAEAIHKIGNSSIIPSQFNLMQNYPNPFNPATVIQYDLPKKSNVNLTIYDVLGREVKTLVNEVKEAGRYTVNFNASSLSSGIYIYKITAGNYVTAKKMMLLK